MTNVPDETWEPFITSFEPKGLVWFKYQRQKTDSARGFVWDNLISCLNLKSCESYMNLLTLPLVNPRHHIVKLKGFAYLLSEAFLLPILMPIWNFCTLCVSSGKPISQGQTAVTALSLDWICLPWDICIAQRVSYISVTYILLDLIAYKGHTH